MTPATVAVTRPNHQRSSRRARREAWWFYAFIAPWLLGFLFLSALPLLFGLYTSFTNYDGLNLGNLKFVGLDNYWRVFDDAKALWGLQRTTLFALINVPLVLGLCFALAVVLNQPIRGRGLFRTLFYIPSILPIVAVAWIWKLMMNDNVGLVNAFLDWLWPGTVVHWLSEYAFVVLVILTLWISLGGTSLVFLAGLQAVPRELEEAALIDGANKVQMFSRITLPLVTPVLFYQLVLGIIFSLQVLVEPILLSGGTLQARPPRDNYTYMVHVFDQTFGRHRFGYGAALIWLLFVVILVLTLIVFRTSRYWVYYEVEQEGKR